MGEITGDVRKRMDEWLSSPIDGESRNEIEKLAKAGDSVALNECFYQDLEFGTGGMRGIMGNGSARMNRYTLGKASEAVADYFSNAQMPPGCQKSAVVSYDTRNNSALFSKIAAIAFARSGFTVTRMPVPTPTPVLSFAVRETKSRFGVMITASHNPKEYNGYKVYDETGCQVVFPVDESIVRIYNGITGYRAYETAEYDEWAGKGKIIEAGDDLYERYLAAIMPNARDTALRDTLRNLSIVYTSLHGTGYDMFKRMAERLGCTNLHYPDAQIIPDGNFPTTPSPNPEDPRALEIALALAADKGGEIVIATDPDADRIGFCFKNREGSGAEKSEPYFTPNGNETGIMLLHYCLQTLLKSAGESVDPRRYFTVNTIVTTDLQLIVSNFFGVEMKRTLTGFKYIGELINKTTDKQYLFGCEESYGYLIGTHARDKDAIVTALLGLEFASYLKTAGLTAKEYLERIFNQFGHYRNDLVNKSLKGTEAMGKIGIIMSSLRKGNIDTIGGFKVMKMMDYAMGLQDLPASDVIQFIGENMKVTIRPSGTEPKIKFYFQTVEKTALEAQNSMAKLKESFLSIIDRIS